MTIMQTLRAAKAALLANVRTENSDATVAIVDQHIVLNLDGVPFTMYLKDCQEFLARHEAAATKPDRKAIVLSKVRFEFEAVDIPTTPITWRLELVRMVHDNILLERRNASERWQTRTEFGLDEDSFFNICAEIVGSYGAGRLRTYMDTVNEVAEMTADIDTVSKTDDKIADATDADLLRYIYNARTTRMQSGGHNKAHWNGLFGAAYILEANERGLDIDENADGVFNGDGAY